MQHRDIYQIVSQAEWGGNNQHQYQDFDRRAMEKVYTKMLGIREVDRDFSVKGEESHHIKHKKSDVFKSRGKQGKPWMHWMFLHYLFEVKIFEERVSLPSELSTSSATSQFMADLKGLDNPGDTAPSEAQLQELHKSFMPFAVALGNYVENQEGKALTEPVWMLCKGVIQKLLSVGDPRDYIRGEGDHFKKGNEKFAKSEEQRPTNKKSLVVWQLQKFAKRPEITARVGLKRSLSVDTDPHDRQLPLELTPPEAERVKRADKNQKLVFKIRNSLAYRAFRAILWGAAAMLVFGYIYHLSQQNIVTMHDFLNSSLWNLLLPTLVVVFVGMAVAFRARSVRLQLLMPEQPNLAIGGLGSTSVPVSLSLGALKAANPAVPAALLQTYVDQRGGNLDASLSAAVLQQGANDVLSSGHLRPPHGYQSVEGGAAAAAFAGGPTTPMLTAGGEGGSGEG